MTYQEHLEIAKEEGWETGQEFMLNYFAEHYNLSKEEVERIREDIKNSEQ